MQQINRKETVNNKPMSSRDRVIAAMELRKPDRIPVLPCLWLDHVARVASISYGELLAQPERTYDAFYAAREFYNADGMRVAIMPPPDLRERSTLGKPLATRREQRQTGSSRPKMHGSSSRSFIRQLTSNRALAFQILS